MQAPAKPALYDRLGGVYNIATVMDDFIDRIMVDPRLNAKAFMDDLKQTFDKFEVPQPEQEELKAIVESTKEAIVV